jgi:hypothetical protein
MDTIPGLRGDLKDVQAHLAAEAAVSVQAKAVLEATNPATPAVLQGGDTAVADLGADLPTEWLRSRELRKQQISNFVHLIALDGVTDLTREIANTRAGKYEAGYKAKNKVGGRARFVGIVWDSRVHGECSSRPQVRMPALQIPEVARVFDCIRARHGVRTSAPPEPLHPFDIYISLAGGRELDASCRRLFQNLGPPAPVTRLIHVVLDPGSVRDRLNLGRDCGVASIKTYDTMRLTAAPWPKKDLRTTPRLHYRGTYGDIY